MKIISELKVWKDLKFRGESRTIDTSSNNIGNTLGVNWDNEIQSVESISGTWILYIDNWYGNGGVEPVQVCPGQQFQNLQYYYHTNAISSIRRIDGPSECGKYLLSQYVTQ